MTPGFAKRQRGAVLLAMLAVVALGSSWYLVSRLNAESGSIEALRKQRNAEVLNRAKQALIGYVTQRAATSGENNPGRLPCPEAVNNIGTSSEGISAPWIGPPATTTCSSIGRLPWRTLGLEKVVDAASEPLWYVVGPSWRLTNSTSTLLINSNTPSGDIAVDGQQVVALIVAPGAAMNAQTSAGCTARNQARSAPSPIMDARDYIECFDSVTLQFITTASNTSFNDQVVRITVAELLPGIEAAVAHRIEREVAPLLRAMYSGGSWSGSATTPLLPFAAPFEDPSTSAMKGSSGMLQGLLPLTYSETSPMSGVACTPGVTAPRCDPTFVSWSSANMSGASAYSPSCTVTAAQITCTYYYVCPLLGCGPTSVSFTLSANAANVGMAMRELNSATTGMTNVDIAPRTVSGTLNNDGSASIVLNAAAAAPASGAFSSAFNALCGLPPADPTFGCLQSNISVPITLFADHSILDSTTGANLRWFLRNRWHEVAYYAVAPSHLPGGSLSCSSSGTITCLQVTNLADPTKQRALLVLAGRPLSALAQTRPSSSLQNYLDSTENRDGDSIFLQSPVNRSFNDRFVSISKNP